MKTNTPQRHESKLVFCLFFFPLRSRKRLTKCGRKHLEHSTVTDRRTNKRMKTLALPKPPNMTLRSSFMPQLWLIMSHPLNAPSTSILCLPWSWGCCCLTSVICYSQWCNMLSGRPSCCDKTRRRAIPGDELGGMSSQASSSSFSSFSLVFFFLFFHHAVIPWLSSPHWIRQVIWLRVASRLGYHGVESLNPPEKKGYREHLCSH